MWRDPYERGWGERCFTALLALLGVVLGIKVLAAVLTPFIPLLVMACALTGLLLWLLRHPYR